MTAETERMRDGPADVDSGDRMTIDSGATLDHSSGCGTPTPHVIAIGHGRTIVVRGVRPHDESALADLYESLGPDDRYLRFFCAYRPTPDFIRRLANPEDRDGRVVAELTGPTGRRIVGEAGYTVLPNGNGEFAMVVASDWRGWLGPYLLDVVVDLAATRGVANLEAEVLSCNSRMLALIRHRGAVLLEHDGWNASRLMIGTGEDGPAWPAAHDRPRVLVEAAGGRWPSEAAAEAAGLDVITCPGPAQNAGCPVVVGRRCALAAGADAIVVRCAPADPRWDTVVTGHAALHGDVPVIVEDGRRDAEKPAIDEVRAPALLHFHLQAAPYVAGTDGGH
jgi:hypothetical protein